ncbi:PAS domain S-box/diguanylate cyclase (GGDEF) domain-containing protein [Terriglobus roseus DSM 18391]|uniref:PAS domain S-box/diguanylate cyclase (GGDEF) domain-containing protein n=1 Tax=Terriglobus roseus (strain DSM 18391 / NRRL B-41598 / KBS 63) TaxID=926566 RepID=I3ZAY2_TERRK|nr:EAL domain-containing protein [Terriglobus roseus]AFL86400.1 PAS domain S-box/diguanylate cyclase (GGDEF) domain-containing protein [Terriglobus roseus DSM 18391]
MKTLGFKPAPLPTDEARRLAILHEYCVMDTPPEPAFDHLVNLAAALFHVPIALITLIDEHKQFFKSAYGTPYTESPRSTAFCSFTILSNNPLIVLDATKDKRFRNNPSVLAGPQVRFYAGCPLIGREGAALGSFCIVDVHPRDTFTPQQIDQLRRFADLATHALDERLFPIRISSAENSLKEANTRYQLATQATTEGIWDWDCATGTIFQSARLRSLIGEQPVDGTVALSDWVDRIYPMDRPAANVNLSQLLNGKVDHYEIEYRIAHTDGTWRWMHNRGIAVRDNTGNLLRVVGALGDITARKFIDPLTGLHARASLLHTLDQRFATAGAFEDGSFSLLLIDLDSFKRVNVSLGRTGGDLLLVECAGRLNALASDIPGALIARLAGDEFAILLNHSEGEEEAVALARRIIAALEDPFEIEGHNVSTSAKIGIAVSHPSCNRAGLFLQRAEVARHTSKESSEHRIAVFSASMHEQYMRRISLASDLREALAEEALTLHYQPKFDLASNTLIGFEALARWNHETLGPISPTEFVPIAEECDLIQQLGRWTLHKAIQQLSDWRAAGLISPETSMAVNLSARQFSDPDLLSNLKRKLKRHNLPAHCLELEVTEGMLIRDGNQAALILESLKTIGIGLDLDDFGTGYSSMTYLQKFPFDSLKIDRCFVMNMHEDAGSAAIVRSIIALGHALNLSLVAEGIENNTQLSMLREMGCDSGQGYFLSHPLSPIAMGDFLSNTRASITPQ